MKVREVLHISTKNLRVYRKRNLILMAVMGVIFGLILTLNLWFQGLKNAYFDLAGRATDGKVIILATNSLEGMVADEARPVVTAAEMKADIEVHGGKVLGDAERFGAFGGVILPAELVSGAIAANLSQVPDDAAPVLVTTIIGEVLLERSFPEHYNSATKKQQDYEAFRQDLIGQTFTDAYGGAKYYVVGLSSGNFHVSDLSFQQLERKNSNLLNSLLLDYLATPDGAAIVIDNGRQSSWEAGESILDGMVTSRYDQIVAVFDNVERAYGYFRHGNGHFMNVDFQDRTYTVDVLAGVSPEVQYVLEVVQIILNIISVVLGVVAAVVVIFTSIRLVDQDQRNIALYYSLGATAKQVRAIYLCYFLELMIGAAVFAFVLASGIVLAFSGLNQELLSIQAELGFNLGAAPTVIWYGVNWETLIIILAMLLLAPICVWLNRRRLRGEALAG